jgi:hypothetical protein
MVKSNPKLFSTRFTRITRFQRFAKSKVKNHSSRDPHFKNQSGFAFIGFTGAAGSNSGFLGVLASCAGEQHFPLIDF